MRQHPTLGLLLLTLTACSANVSSPGESDADANTQTTAVVTFERVVSSTAGADQVRGTATARFVQARTGSRDPGQVDDRSLKFVGAAFESPPSFGCVSLDRNDADSAGQALELADVGTLSVASAPAGQSAQHVQHAFPLVPRQVPDPVGLVGGVLYYGNNPELSQVVPGTRYSVRGSGSQGVAAFELAGTSPFEVADLSFGGIRVAGQRAPIQLASSQPAVEIAWSTADAARESGDIFFVDVARVGASSVRCAADASGATIPSSVFAGVSPSDDVAGTISVHRVHRERARSTGTGVSRSAFESSEVRFDFSRVISFTRH